MSIVHHNIADRGHLNQFPGGEGLGWGKRLSRRINRVGDRAMEFSIKMNGIVVKGACVDSGGVLHFSGSGRMRKNVLGVGRRACGLYSC